MFISVQLIHCLAYVLVCVCCNGGFMKRIGKELLPYALYYQQDKAVKSYFVNFQKKKENSILEESNNNKVVQHHYKMLHINV